MENDDIVYLNVGGKKMATKRSTLCQVDGSLLASMFSGRWEDSIVRDEDGHVFLDYNPKLFAVVLDYLRAKQTETPNKPASLPPVSLEDNVRFRSLVEYLGVDITQNNEQASVESMKDASGKHKFEFYSEGILLKENGTVAIHANTGTCRHEYVIIGTSDRSWRLHLKSVGRNSSIFVGVLSTQNCESCIAQSLQQRAENTYLSPSTWGAYGWILGENSQTCSNGVMSPTSNFGVLGKEGDTVELHIKLNDKSFYFNDTVSLLLRPSGLKLSNSSLPQRQTWQCVIGLYQPGDCITLLS